MWDLDWNHESSTHNAKSKYVLHVLTLKHVHVASTKIKCFTADRKTVFILLFSRSGMCVQFRTAFGVLPYHIPVVGIHSDRTMFYRLGWEIEIISFLLFTHGVRITEASHSPYWEEKNRKGVGYGTDLLEFFICNARSHTEARARARSLDSGALW